MTDYRITSHPILPIPERETVEFNWKGRPHSAKTGETISAALFAHGIRIFGYHHKDGSPQGIFCANGQCAQCTVIANGLPVKACMTLIEPGMVIEPVRGLPSLPVARPARSFISPRTVEVDCLVVGGGPAGLSAAVEMGQRGINVLLVDDKHRLGGKLVLQTHRFFGSINACYAGTRGIDIATKLAGDVEKYPSVETWLNATAVAVFSDCKVGVVRDGEYLFVQPRVILVAAGAREKNLTFKGNTLPGVYGAGAFQTLVNRDLVRPSEKLFIVGGGNVGLIAGYHALQAGIHVVGLVEALPECGGYKVHKDKLVRMGIPIHASHTVVSANGKEGVESVTIAKVDEKWQPVAGTEVTYECDTLLIAVGLDPVDEFYHKAKEFGLPVFAAGDADEVAEASAAMFSGKIRGMEIAQFLGKGEAQVPPEWVRTSEILRSRPGEISHETIPTGQGEVYPVLHCSQEIPCNPCTSVCSQGSIVIDPEDIRKVPDYIAKAIGKECIACEKCVNICPGLAITLVDARGSDGTVLVTVPYEFERGSIEKGDFVTVTDTTGINLGKVQVARIRLGKATDRTVLVKLIAPKEIATRIAGIQVQEVSFSQPMDQWVERLEDDTIVCRCERVTLSEIKDVIRSGVRDMNAIKALTRAGMGSCGGKTCSMLIKRAFRELGIPLSEVTEGTHRPLFVEVPMGVLAGEKGE
jgi:NADPH-dependent 2,4-dienoyl-CoA reductase/sulfur reductase-like enzyme/Fe-S-cluster-containing hydrogenase component 2